MIHIKNYSLGAKQLSLIHSIEEDSLVETIILDLKSGLIRGMASEGLIREGQILIQNILPLSLVYGKR